MAKKRQFKSARVSEHYFAVTEERSDRAWINIAFYSGAQDKGCHTVEVRVSKSSVLDEGPAGIYQTTVSWPSIGAVPADDAAEFAAAIVYGVRAGKRLQAKYTAKDKATA